MIDELLGEAGRRLGRTLIDDRGVASSVSPFYQALTDVGVWGVNIGTRDADVEVAIAVVKEELHALRDRPHPGGRPGGSQGVPPRAAAAQSGAQRRPRRTAREGRGARHLREPRHPPSASRAREHRGCAASGPDASRSGAADARRPSPATDGLIRSKPAATGREPAPSAAPTLQGVHGNTRAGHGGVAISSLHARRRGPGWAASW